MRLLSKKEIQQRLLAMGMHVSNIAAKNDIRCFIFYGTLLGAKRHGGFIPWDDDFDICVDKRDLNKLVQALKDDDESDFRLVDYMDDGSYTNWVLKVNDTKTTVKVNQNAFQVNARDYTSNIFGLTIDIYPLLQGPSRKTHLKLIGKLFRFEELLGGRLKKVFREIFEKILLLLFKNSETFFTRASFEKVFCSNNIYPLKRISFENKKFNAPSNSNSCLEELYDDFMRIPSKAQQDKWIHYKEVYFKDEQLDKSK